MNALALLSKAAGTALWFAYLAVLARTLSTEALGPVLYAIGLAGLAGGLMAAGSAQSILRDGAPEPARIGPLLGTGLGRALTGGGLATLVLLSGAWLGVLPFALPEAAATAAAGLILGVTGLLGAAQRARGALGMVLLAQGPLRPGLPLLLTLATPTGDPFLMFCLGLLGAAAILLPGCPRPRRGSRSAPGVRTLWQGQAGWLLLGQADLIVAGLFLSPTALAGYLIARRIAGLLATVFDALRLAAAAPLARAFRDGRGAAEGAALNRRFLVWGGGGAVGIAALSPWLIPLIGAETSVSAAVLAALIAGQATPAIFGATGLALVMSRNETAWLRLLVGSCAAAFALAAAGATFGALPLAVAAAVAALLHGARAACLLARTTGIRPPVAGALIARCAAAPRAGSAPG